jgi:hypothetical protein
MIVGQVEDMEKQGLQLNLLHIKANSEILPGWTLTFDEVSNNVYKVTLRDRFGRLSETTDRDLENAIMTVETFAFDMQKQISKGWNKFLYNTCIIKLGDKKIVEKQYHDEVFGSWYILLTDNRILLDGRDFNFCIQVYKNEWVDTTSIKLSELTYADFVTAIGRTK